MLSNGLVVAGYALASSGLRTGTKLFFIFICPLMGLSVGIFEVESYFNKIGNSQDYPFGWHGNRNNPNLNQLLVTMAFSMITYLLVTLVLPLDVNSLLAAITGSSSNSEMAAQLHCSKGDELDYPCDMEETAGEGEGEGESEGKGGDGENKKHQSRPISAPAVLSVNKLTHIYPDGTHAVKNISFDVKAGEVLSFLGANGAGKSTTMGMLCGTLTATFGDALVNGYSITTSRTQVNISILHHSTHHVSYILT